MSPAPAAASRACFPPNRGRWLHFVIKRGGGAIPWDINREGAAICCHVPPEDSRHSASGRLMLGKCALHSAARAAHWEGAESYISLLSLLQYDSIDYCHGLARACRANSIAVSWAESRHPGPARSWRTCCAFIATSPSSPTRRRTRLARQKNAPTHPLTHSLAHPS